MCPLHCPVLVLLASRLLGILQMEIKGIHHRNSTQERDVIKLVHVRETASSGRKEVLVLLLLNRAWETNRAQGAVLKKLRQERVHPSHV